MRYIVAVFLCTLLITGAMARSRKRSTAAHGVPGEFDYYLLSLSWAPDFCDRPDVQKDMRECGSGRRVGFVVHGLWPQQDNGGHPSECAPARPVAQSIVQRMLAFIPSEGLIQHEWRDHGTCSGLSSSDYFNLVAKADQEIVIPADFKQPGQAIEASPEQIEAKFIAANPRFRESVRVACSAGELSEVRICMGKDLSPHACSVHDRDCPAPAIKMLPVR